MGVISFFNSETFTFVLIPLLIFFARILDVSIGTIRVIFISRGFKHWAPILGFFEVLIWLAAIRQIMANLSNVYTFLAYAFGFAAGTYIGIWLEERISVGKVLLRVHIRNDASKLLEKLKRANYPLISYDAQDNKGLVKMISIIANRQAIPKILEMVKKYDTHLVYSVEDVRFANDGDLFKRSNRLR
ncbi:MAG: hypothetical protein KJ939_03265, partial [Nanoarchaeota archaeon]|nr:hypothetical protein [Nanoarchaeota archaeon]